MRFLFRTSHAKDFELFQHGGQVFWYGLLAAALLAAPLFLDPFYLGELSQVFIYAIAGVGLMLLVGYTGMVSLGHAAFLAIGAYAHARFMTYGVPFVPSMIGASLFTGVIACIVGLPVLRMTGVYLAVATLALAEIVEQILTHWESATGGFRGMRVPEPELFGLLLDAPTPFYFICLFVLTLCMFGALNVLRTPTGRSLVAVRDSETSAVSMGISLVRAKTTAFTLSGLFAGLAGALFAHRIGHLAPDAFTLLTSIQLLLMVVVGGLGSMHGVIFGAIFIGLLPQAIALGRDVVPQGIGALPGLEPAIFGAILIAFLIFEPDGIYGRWVKIRRYFEEFPLYRKDTFKRQRRFLHTERLR